MKFQSLLELYEDLIERYTFKQERCGTDESKTLEGIHTFFKCAKYLCGDYAEVTNSRAPTQEEQEKYQYKNKDYTDNVELIIDYRDDTIPLYVDDYGQCFYTIIGGKEYGLGTYNRNVSEACDIYDDYLFKLKGSNKE